MAGKVSDHRGTNNIGAQKEPAGDGEDGCRESIDRGFCVRTIAKLVFLFCLARGTPLTLTLSHEGERGLCIAPASAAG